ncbi:DJ-1/PfpI family protein [Pseudokordiimonas caeni]|uniref:DJ-1/PfpI family protein n=1 Tax=Pseudokordiimonas caeni TaxID=2997908 RepID=UPI002810D381|nr:DJ-1/PfpI family protein [Pseudokordiimonas caeni]
MTIEIGFLLFNGLTQLDFAGPFEVLSRVPGARVHLVADSLDAITADTGLRLLPTTTYEECPQLNVLCVPGGPHVESLYENEAALDFLRQQAAEADYVTSVCTGSLILGAAGLLEGYKATSHWSSVGLLGHFGATPTRGRVVTDRNRITGGGVTAGIDFGLTVAAALAGEQAAKMIQLGLEYNPEPPFNCGHPDVAEKDVINAVITAMQDRLDTRIKRAAAFA